MGHETILAVNTDFGRLVIMGVSSRVTCRFVMSIALEVEAELHGGMTGRDIPRHQEP